MKVVVIGSGNIGTYFAVEFSSKTYDVEIISSKPNEIKDTLKIVYDDNSSVKTASKIKVSDNIEIAIKDADVILITHPAFMIPETAKSVSKHIKAGAAVGLVPGTGGGEFAFKQCIDEKSITVFGLQRVPAIARLIKYGDTVRVSGIRNKLHIAAIQSKNAPKYAELLSEVFEIPCEILPNYLCVTLTPSNPILHTTRLRTLFNDYHEGVVYTQNPLFYEEWSDETSRLLLECDDELQKICKALTPLDLTSVRSLKQHYESDTPEALTTKLRSLKSLNGLKSPMIEVENGFVPDLSSRYFTADFPYGLAIIKQIADIAAVGVPHIDETMRWYQTISGNYSVLDLADYNITTLDNLYGFYISN